MKKKKLIFANWKMNFNSEQARVLVESIIDKLNKLELLKGTALKIDAEVVLAPAFPSLSFVSSLIRHTGISLSSQDVFWEAKGPYTGEVSPSMLIDVGCTWAMIGHSERRQHLLETNEMINKKVLNALSQDLNIILCVGESFEQRRRKNTFEAISDQLRRGLRGVTESQLNESEVVIGYEPVWVIGSGEAASVEDIASVHNFVSDELKSIFPGLKSLPRIVYGGSVNSENIEQIASLSNVDGVLVGNASMDCDKFCDIVLKVVK